jgi:uncharacterized membrane protein YagU involved in acid resistance
MPHVLAAPRDELHSATDWSAGAWGGVIAGIVFMMLEMGMVRMFMGESPWTPPRMIAAMVLGQGVLPEPGSYAPFDMKIMATAMVIHMMLSIVYGLKMAQNWISAVARTMFGVAAGGAYVGLRRPKPAKA